MDDHGSAYSNPHWNADLSLIKDPSKIPAKALGIVWGNDSRYWQWTRLKEEHVQKTGFEEAAVLLQVNWLEVTGRVEIEQLLKGMAAKTHQTYRLCYVMRFRADAFGWHSVPIKFKIKVKGEETARHSLNLESYRVKYDEWHEIPGGEFTVSGDTCGRVEFGMFEVDSKWWKGSAVLAGVKIEPKLPN